ncbi:MAG: hypothetical protein JO223_11220 [Hyphomicrobiales bacterium]|nr:hypothetical protein [Hyphomicrobiales bacterium]MBV8443744.1 hypothetical protein [Hyphomicrobiales bacterium]
MRTETFLPPVTSCAIVLAAIVVAAAVGAPGPALAACGVSSGTPSTGIRPAGANTGTHAGATGSTHGVSSSSCPSMTNKTVTTNIAGGGLGGMHPLSVKTGVIHQNVQTNNLHTTTHTGTTNTKSVRVPKKT